MKQSFYSKFSDKIKKNIRAILWAIMVIALSTITFALRLTLLQEIVMLFVLITLCGFFYMIYLIGWRYLRKRVRRLLGYILFPCVALIIVMWVLQRFYPGEYPELSDTMAFMGDYLSFIGAFSLGYFIYLKDEERRDNDEKKKVRSLREDIERIDKSLLCIIKAFDELGTDKAVNIQGTIEPFEYDRNWRTSYYIYEAIAGSDPILQSSIEKFFDMVDTVNRKLKSNDIMGIQKAYNDYLEESEIYDYSGYDLLKIELMLFEAENEIKLRYNIWNIQERKTQREVKKWKKGLYLYVENYIYNLLVKSGESFEGNGTDIQRKTAKWIMENCNDMKTFLTDSDKKTKVINCVVLSCSLDFNEKSSKVKYGWNTYTLR